jgi:hypothetical protein
LFPFGHDDGHNDHTDEQHQAGTASENEYLD